MNMYPSLDRRRPMRNPPNHQQRAPSARELLEASKKLYVQTEFLRAHRIDPNAPRLFRTDSEEELSQLYHNTIRLPAELAPAKNDISTCLRDQTNGLKPNSSTKFDEQTLSSRKSAFKPIERVPPRPPKNDALIKRQNELAGCSQWTTPPSALTKSLPSYEEFISENGQNNVKQKENRPIPPPRRSLLKSNVKQPVALPRRRQTTTFVGEIPDMSMTQSTYIDGSEARRLRSQATSTTNLLTKSTPDLSLELLINSIPNQINQNSSTASTYISPNECEMPKKPNELYVRPLRSISDHPVEAAKPPRPPTNPNSRIKRSSSNNVSRRSSSSFPSPDSSKDSGVLCATPEIIQITTDSDFEERVKRWERRKTIGSPLRPIAEQPKIVQDQKSTSTSNSSPKPIYELYSSKTLNPRLLNGIQFNETHEDSDLVSDFTSVTAERKKVEDLDEDLNEDVQKRPLPLASSDKPVSQFEKNARVLRWIYGCSGSGEKYEVLVD